MTGAPDDTILPAADPAAIAAAEQAQAALKAAAEAKAKHDADVANLAAHKGRVDAVLDDLRAKLQASIDEAAGDPGHVNYAAAFLTDVELKGTEIVNWIGRHIGTAA